MAAHLALLVASAFNNSVTFDEYAHLPAGVAYWKHGLRAFAIHNLSPPLLRLIAGAPVALAGADAPDVEPFLSQGPRDRHWNYGFAFERANFDRYHRLFVIGRLAMAVISCVGLLIVWKWAGEMYGPRAALAAALIYAPLPDVVANGSLVGTDLGTAVAMTAALWLWWRWAQRPGALRLALCVFAVLAAMLCKFTAILLFPVLIAMGVCFVIQRTLTWRATLMGLATCIATTWGSINLAYGLAGSFRAISSYTFQSNTLKLVASILPAATPVPLPSNFVEGFDIQKHETELGVPAYLLGHSYRGSRWDYYPIALASKLPLGALAVIALAGLSTVARSRHVPPPRRDELPLAVALVVFVIGMIVLADVNIGVRYVLPAYPIAIVLASRVFEDRFTPGHLAPGHDRGQSVSRFDLIRWGCIALLLVESLLVAPRWISFMNVAVGGSSRGWPIVNDSNFDWGQGLFDLKGWMKEHGVPRVALTYFGRVDPAVYGIDYTLTIAADDDSVVAVSSYYLLGLAHRLPTSQGSTGYRSLPYAAELRRKTPIGRAGPTIFLFRSADVRAAARAHGERPN